MDEFIGIIKIFGGNFAPRGWALCNGQLMSIAQNSALFSILGTVYGGDGQTTFGLPDLRGRTPIGVGQGPGLSNYTQGEISGTENVTILASQMPMHTHSLLASDTTATTNSPTGGVLAQPNYTDVDGNAVPVNGYTTVAPDKATSPAAVGASGGSQPLPIMQPFMAINYIICLEGIFPSRS